MSDEYGNKVVLRGTLVSKRFNTKTKEPVLNLFVRTGNSRGGKFCIGVNIWGKPAKLLNRALGNVVDAEDGESVSEDEAPMLKVKGELRYDFWETEDGSTVGRHTVTASRVDIEDDEDDDE